MNLREQRAHFEKTKKIYERAKLKFHGVEGYDVYNASIPFEWKGKSYIYGRVERRKDWARSWVRLFQKTGKDVWSLVPNSMIYQLEDPYVAMIGKEIVLGGTHVRYKSGEVDTYYGYFYKGTDLDDLYYFTTGPDYMKDIRLVQLRDGRIGVFSRPRNKEIMRKFGCESQIGFTIIKKLEDLTGDVIENAPYIPGLFDKLEWGGCNQAYLLDSGNIGVIGHKCYNEVNNKGVTIATYMNIAFVFDIKKHRALDVKIIGTRPCYPKGPAKKPELVDCAFTSGIVMRKDGKADLYSGIGDVEVGRITIDYPFAGHGKIVTK
ncbi:MAG TPA: hypothetical protein DCZ94_12015 [Lentisphaeria bacterium]|nr:MAG: hypothetical protein A2X48_09390 [Lentisphaerae bacterium GWF2_49_21]HBC87674.1 hypothetical protein [Lentisphaeria bacterium]